MATIKDCYTLELYEEEKQLILNALENHVTHLNYKLAGIYSATTKAIKNIYDSEVKSKNRYYAGLTKSNVYDLPRTSFSSRIKAEKYINHYFQNLAEIEIIKLEEIESEIRKLIRYIRKIKVNEIIKASKENYQKIPHSPNTIT